MQANRIGVAKYETTGFVQKQSFEERFDCEFGPPSRRHLVEEANPIHTTTVVYAITSKEGRFRVSGVDESDGIVLRISNACWDGEKLCFVSLSPPTNHEGFLIEKERAEECVNRSLTGWGPLS